VSAARLIKRRPRVALLTPRVIHAGEPFTVTIDLDARRDVPIDGLDVRLSGSETIFAGKAARTREFVRLGARLMGEGVLRAGRASYKCAFDLPKDAPPSYTSDHVRVTYEMLVHVSVPWWPDVRDRFEVFVQRSTVARMIEGKAVVVSTAPSGPRGKEPYVEVSLDSDVVAAGGTLTGAVSLGNVAANRYRTIHAGAVCTETIDLGQLAHFPRQENIVRVADASSLVDGQAVPFLVAVPWTMQSMSSELWSLDCSVDVRVEIAWAPDIGISIPIRVLHGVDRLVDRPLAVPPSVGSDRVRAIWERVASDPKLAREIQRAGLAAGDGLSFDGEALSGASGEVRVRVARENRGREGVFLVARLAYPSLDIGLGPGGWLAGRPKAAIGPRFRASAREAAQLAAAASALAAVTRIEWLADDQAVVAERDAGQDFAKLTAFVLDALVAARAIDTLRDRIPPPEVMKDELPGWRKLAAELAGRLSIGSMSVEGRLDGIAAEVRTEWSPSGDPARTRIVLHSRQTTGEMGAEARAIARALEGGERTLVVSAEEMTLYAKAPIDPAQALDLLRRLVRLSVALRAGAGPYR